MSLISTYSFPSAREVLHCEEAHGELLYTLIPEKDGKPTSFASVEHAIGFLFPNFTPIRQLEITSHVLASLADGLKAAQLAKL